MVLETNQGHHLCSRSYIRGFIVNYIVSGVTAFSGKPLPGKWARNAAVGILHRIVSS